MNATRTAESPKVRTYGGWRLARGYGIAGLTGRQTLIVVGTAVAVLSTAAISVPAALWTTPAAALVIAAAVARWRGVPLTDAITARVRWWQAVAQGWHEYRAGVVVDHPRAWQLPGVLAPLVLLDAEDHAGRRYAVTWDRRTGLLSATLGVAAVSPWLADGQAADGWVANWGAWLTSLGYRPGIKWVTVTVETAPEAGAALADYVDSQVDPASPEPARAMMRQLVDASPAAAADVDTRVTLTFDPASTTARAPTLSEQLAELDRELETAAAVLGGCGVSVLGRRTPAHTAGTTRVAFDPSARGDVDRALSGSDASVLLDWRSSGPVAATERWDSYRHDSGHSISWTLHEPPRQAVTSHVLAHLMAPGPFTKRVTLLFRPMAADAAAALVEQQTNAAAFRAAVRRRSGQDTTQREQADYEHATRAAREEAQGAGVCSFTIYVTATCTDPEQLPRMASAVESAAQHAKLRVRRAYGSQAVCFAASLSLGISPAHLAGKRPR